MDLKLVSLEYYHQQIKVSFKTSSPSYKKYGKECTGKLTGRIWGDKLVPTDMGDKKLVETVIALTLQLTDKEVNFPAEDIESITKVNSL